MHEFNYAIVLRTLLYPRYQQLAVLVFRRVPLLSACRVPLLSACAFALGLCLCSRLVPVLSACACAIGLCALSLCALGLCFRSRFCCNGLLSFLGFWPRSRFRSVVWFWPRSVQPFSFLWAFICASAALGRLCLASGLCASLWDFCALLQAFVPFFGFSLGLLRTFFGPPRLLRPAFSFGVLIFASCLLYFFTAMWPRLRSL